MSTPEQPGNPSEEPDKHRSEEELAHDAAVARGEMTPEAAARLELIRTIAAGRSLSAAELALLLP